MPTIAIEHLSDDQIAAFKIADNRISELATWNDALLAEQLRDLALLNLDFSLELTGFDMPEIDLRIESLDIAPESGTPDPADTGPAPVADPAVSALGDLWRLGPHRLLCASALDAASYDTLMDGTRAAMVFTDPPYNVPIGGHVSGLGQIQHREFAMGCGEMSSAEFQDFLHQAWVVSPVVV